VGRLIFHVEDVDAWWEHLTAFGFKPEPPRNVSWGERYFHMLDPDGHELSFARRLGVLPNLQPEPVDVRNADLWLNQPGESVFASCKNWYLAAGEAPHLIVELLG
jgi:Glyoxalase/Bleomycin resistance protein/Dioxygenase superfamily